MCLKINIFHFFIFIIQESESESSKSSCSEGSDNSSDSSDNSSSSGSSDEEGNSASSSSDEEEEEEVVNEPNKPLPRRKPQLVAPEPRRFLSEAEGGKEGEASTSEDLSDGSDQLNSKLNSLGLNSPKLSATSRGSTNNNCDIKSLASQRTKSGAKGAIGRSSLVDDKSSSSKGVSITSVARQKNAQHVNSDHNQNLKDVSESEDSLFAMPQKSAASKSIEKKSNKKCDMDVEFDRLLTNNRQKTGTAPITDDNNMPILIGRGRRKFKPLLPYKVDPPDQNGKNPPKNLNVTHNPVPSSSRSHMSSSFDNNTHVKRVKVEERTEVQCSSEYISVPSVYNKSSDKNVGNKLICDGVCRKNDILGSKPNSIKGSSEIIGNNCSSLSGGVRPTIADLVKVRERRKSFDRDTSSGSEWERRKSGDADGKQYKSSRKKSATQSSGGPRISRKLSQSSIDSSSSCLSESVTSDGEINSRRKGDASTDSSFDSNNLDDDAEPGEALPVPTYLSDPLGASTFSFMPVVSPPGAAQRQKSLHISPKASLRQDASKEQQSVNCKNSCLESNKNSERRNYAKSCRKDCSVDERRCCYKDSSSDSDEDSSLSDSNIQVDLDTEQTQTFSLSENNLNQVGLNFLFIGFPL